MTGTINPRHTAEIINLINSSPYISLLSISVVAIDSGICLLEISLGEKHLNPFGGLHGGVYSSAIDTAAYWASYCSIPENAGLISVDLHIDNISTVQSGKLLVKGKLIKAGKTVCFSEAAITDETGKLPAHGTSKQLVTYNLQTINKLSETMKCQLLPPKFI